MPRVSGAGTGADRIYVTARLNRLLAQAEDEAKQLKDDYISIEHLLLAMMDDTGWRAGSSKNLVLRANDWQARLNRFAATSGSLRRIRKPLTKL